MMNNFSDFDFYRVSAWMRDGFIMSVAEPVVAAARQAVAKVAMATAVAVGGMSASVAAVAHTGPSGLVTSAISSQQTDAVAEQYAEVEGEIAAMTLEIDSQLAELLDFSSDSFGLDSLALAGRAIESLASPEKLDISKWARNMVSQRS